MYVPKAFEESDLETISNFVEANSFATLVTAIDGQPFATRLPLILDRATGSNGTLIGHVARANPQWRSFDGNHKALAMFDGPHAYISPSWYATSPAVPTWNYVTVHIYGAPRMIDDPSRVEAIVDRLVAIYEAPMPRPWVGDIPPDFKAKLLKGIVGFEMEIERVQAKFKLGQNRPLEDQLGTLEQLSNSPVATSRELAELTRKRLQIKG